MCRFPSAVASDVVVCGFSRDTFIYSLSPPPSDAAAAAVSCGIRKPLNLTRRGGGGGGCGLRSLGTLVGSLVTWYV